MKKFEGMLICTDLDGTLLRSDKSISQNTLDTIEYFKSEGGYFTFVTGRMPFYAKDMYEMVNPNCPFGCVNGGGIYDHVKQEYIWSITLPKSVIELTEYVEKNLDAIGYQVNTLDKVYFCKQNSATKRFRELTKVPNLELAVKDIQEPIAKIIFCDEKEENIAAVQELLDKHPRADEFDFIRSEKTLYEILPKGISKATALTKLAQFLNIDMDKTIAIGDYNNDITMLRTAKLGVAVSNACADAKAAADYVTVSNDEDAVAKIIHELDEGIIKL